MGRTGDANKMGELIMSVFFITSQAVIMAQPQPQDQPQFTTAQRVFLVNTYTRTGNYAQTQRLFAARFPRVRVPEVKWVITIHKYRDNV